MISNGLELGTVFMTFSLEVLMADSLGFGSDDFSSTRSFRDRQILTINLVDVIALTQEKQRK